MAYQAYINNSVGGAALWDIGMMGADLMFNQSNVQTILKLISGGGVEITGDIKLISPYTGLYSYPYDYKFTAADLASGIPGWVSNTIISAQSFYESSDIRYKTVLETNPNIDLSAIDVIKFTRNDDDSSKVRYGYSAQQVQSILPDLVIGEDKLNVNYTDVHTLKIAALEKRIAELESKLNKLIK